MNQESEKRLVWLDVIKGIAIICVIIGHTVKQRSFVKSLIFSFHMPILFIVSGFTIKKISSKDLKQVTIKDFKRLIFPISIAILIETTLRFFLDSEDFITIIKQELNKIFWGNGNNFYYIYLDKKITFYGIGVFWFLIALFWAKLLFRILLIKTNEKVRFISCLILGFLGIYIGGKEIILPHSIDIVFVAMIFMEFGFWLNKNTKKIESTSITSIILTLVLFCFWIYMSIKKEIYIEIALRKYPLFSISTALIASWCIIRFSKLIEKFNISKLLAFLGNNSLLLMCIHHFDGYYYDLWYISNYVPIHCILKILVDIIVLLTLIFLKNSFKIILPEKSK